MAVYYGRDGRTQYELDKQLKSGGEGIVYTIKGMPDSVAKIYKPERVADPQIRNATRDKILAMLDMNFSPRLNGRIIVAWPEDALFDSAHIFQGFVMPKIQNMKSLIWAMRPSDRDALWANGYRWHYSVAIAYNLALTIEQMHKAGIVVGDMNTNNVLIDAKGNVTLIDADSFNITTKTGQIYKCIVGFPEVLPPELQGKDLAKPTINFTEKTDCFSLAVHVFNIVCNNCHPFGCLNYSQAHGSSSTPRIMDNIVKGYCPYVTKAKGKTVDDALDMDVFPRELRDLFDRAFSYDATTAVKQATIFNRPSAQEWRTVLGNLYSAGVSTCKSNKLHEYPKSYTKGCPWCAIEKRKPQMIQMSQTQTVQPVQYVAQQTFSQTKKTTTQNATNSVNKTIPIKAKKTHLLKKICIFLLIAMLAFSIIMYIDAKTAANEGYFEQAKRSLDLIPFYKTLFPSDYYYVAGEAQRIEGERNRNAYNQAITYYRNGEYKEAYQLFNKLDISYEQTALYMDFCQAHIHQSTGYFSTIYDNMYFEDAKSLLTSDSQMFCRYMEGRWLTNTSSGQQVVTVTSTRSGEYSINGLPELPQGKMFYIYDGVLGYYDTAYVMWSDTDLFQIDVISKTYFTLYSYQSGMTYYLSKEY